MVAIGHGEAPEPGGIALFTTLCTMEENSVQETPVESRTEKGKLNRSGGWVDLCSEAGSS